MSRMINAACWIITGIILMAVGISDRSMGALAWIGALGMIGYGGYVAFTKRTYWISYYIYLIPIGAAALMYFSSTGKA